MISLEAEESVCFSQLFFCSISPEGFFFVIAVTFPLPLPPPPPLFHCSASISEKKMVGEEGQIPKMGEKESKNRGSFPSDLSRILPFTGLYFAGPLLSRPVRLTGAPGPGEKYPQCSKSQVGNLPEPEITIARPLFPSVSLPLFSSL